MNYGLARKISWYDFDSDKSGSFIARPGAWNAAMLWVSENVPADSPTANVDQLYVWAYFAAKKTGQEFAQDLPDNLTMDVIASMYDRFSFEFEEVSEKDIPFRAPRRKK